MISLDSAPEPSVSIVNFRRWLAGALFVLAIFALDGCATVGRRLVIPAKLQGDARGQLAADPAYEIVPLRTKEGVRIFGQFGRAEFPSDAANGDPAHAPTVIFFYGASQNLTAPHNQIVFRGLRAMGVNVFIPEYPGNGMSEGSASERGCYAAADAALDYLLGRPDIDHTRIVAAGQSLGSGPAVDLASRRPLAGLITVSGFTTTTEAGMNGLTWMPHWIVKSLTAECRFDNLAKIKTVSCPILLVYGTRDVIVPPAMTERLAQAAAGPVAKLAVPSDHNSLWKSPYFGLNRAVGNWLQAR